MTDVERIWNEDEWTKTARDITRAFEDFSKDSKIILIVRHTHRNELTDSVKLYKLRNIDLYTKLMILSNHSFKSKRP